MYNDKKKHRLCKGNEWKDIISLLQEAVFSNGPQGSTGMPVGECDPERMSATAGGSAGLPAQPVERSSFFLLLRVPRACPWVSIVAPT